MARYHAPDDDTVVYKISRRKLVFIFTALVLIMISVFITGIFIGRGQRAVKEELAPPPVVVQKQPAVKTPQDIPIEPIPAGNEGVPIDRSTTPVTPKSAPQTTPEEKTPPSTIEKPIPHPTPSPPKSQITPGRFVIQIIATGLPKKAEILQQNLQQKGFPAFIDRTNPRLLRVMVGPYQTREEAAKGLELLKPVLPHDIHPIVRSLPSDH